MCLLGASGQESGPFETIELTDAMSEPKVTTAAMDGEEMVTIAEGLEVVPSLLPNPELPHLKRALGWISLTSMGVGATIGAGIFVMSAQQTLQPSLCVGAITAGIAGPNRGLQDLMLSRNAFSVSSLCITGLASLRTTLRGRPSASVLWSPPSRAHSLASAMFEQIQGPGQDGGAGSGERRG